MPERSGLLASDDARIVGLTLVAKLVVLGIGIVSVLVVAQQAFAPGPLGWLEIWNRWDAPHYLDIAAFGYSRGDPGALTVDGHARPFPGDLHYYIVFFPLFPWLIAAVRLVVPDVLLSAFLVSTVASLLVGPLLYRLVKADEGPGVGLRAAWFVLIFPTAFVLHIGYTESLFLALVLGSFLAARTHRWWLAGLLGGLAALTRVNGLVLIPALAAEAWLEWDADDQHRVRSEWAAIALVAVGFGGYLVLNKAVYGDPFTFLQIQSAHWFKSLAPPWQGIGDVLGRTFPADPVTGGFGNTFMYGWMELVFIVLGLVGTVVAAVRFRPSWFVWMAGNWLLFTSTSFVLSVPRYTLTLFPLFAWFALLGRNLVVAILISLVSIGFLVYFAGLFAQGQWAF